MSGLGIQNANDKFAIDDNIVATVSGTTFTGPVNFSGAVSGSISNLTSGKSLLVGGNDITITTASDGQITITSNASIENDYTAGTGLNLSSYEFSIQTNITVTVSSNKFVIDGSSAPVISASKSGVFYFDVSDASLSLIHI